MKNKNRNAALIVIFLLIWLSLFHAGWLELKKAPPEAVPRDNLSESALYTFAENNEKTKSFSKNNLSEKSGEDKLDDYPGDRQIDTGSPGTDTYYKTIFWIDEELISRHRIERALVNTGRQPQVETYIMEISPQPTSEEEKPVATVAEPATAVSQPAETVPEITAPVDEVPETNEFWGIDPHITSKWLFPLRVETYTPAQGLFAASRGSRAHAGIDLYAPHGTEVYAMTSGRVRTSYVFYEDLLAFEVENDDGTMIRYTELDPLVKIGDRVEQGQLIARLRKNSSGSCMLHLEIYATCSSQPLTQTDNSSNYQYVSASGRSFMRRSDLVDPSAVYSLLPDPSDVR